MSRFDLSTFKKYYVTSGSPSISITKNGITFSKAAIMKLNRAPFVTLLIDDDQRLMAVRKAEDGEDGSTSFFTSKKKVISVRWNNRELLTTMSQMMDWELEKGGFRVQAEYDKENEALFFDLNEAVPLSDSDESDEI